MDIGDLGYDAFMLPLELTAIRRIRRGLVPLARGRVLEVGAGTGANLPFYRMEAIEGLDLADPALSRRLCGERCLGGVSVRGRCADVQELPFPAASFDTVVSTLVFCSVDDPLRGLREVRRVLRAGGRYLFVEHVLPTSPVLARLAGAVTPLWCAFTGSCRLDRDTLGAVREAGLSVTRLVRGWGGVLVYGEAEPAAS